MGRGGGRERGIQSAGADTLHTDRQRHPMNAIKITVTCSSFPVEASDSTSDSGSSSVSTVLDLALNLDLPDVENSSELKPRLKERLLLSSLSYKINKKG